MRHLPPRNPKLFGNFRKLVSNRRAGTIRSQCGADRDLRAVSLWNLAGGSDTLACMQDITDILSDWKQNGPAASEHLLPMVYDELRCLAAARMAQENPDHTLQPTALVHEAYVRLVDSDQVQSWDSRAHFFAAAATAMRRVLVDWARGKQRDKRGGGQRPLELSDISVETVFGSPRRLLELDDALSKFEQVDSEVAELVRLRLYGGLSMVEAADILGIPRSTAYDRWQFALCWFAVELGG
jgi:RNA polymerase sigma factor (TIGR02999 family)